MPLGVEFHRGKRKKVGLALAACHVSCQKVVLKRWAHRQSVASLAQLAEHALRKRMVVGSIPTGGLALSS
jgi:hypothetical protein